MEKFEYTITKDVYDYILSGKKKLEIRLYNENSSKININDVIKFKVIDSDEYILVKVVALLRYKNIIDLLSDFRDKNIVLNHSTENIEEKFIEIMGEENVRTHEVLGIKFEVFN